jgi:hypothetical protein
MKALSIQQPWAWLIVNGHKNIENRDWPTNFRGKIYVHAGKKLDKDAITYIKHEYPDIQLPDAYDLGGVVGTVVITGCITESLNRWFYGDYGFTLASPHKLPFTPYRGMLGLFEIPEQATATTAA